MSFESRRDALAQRFADKQARRALAREGRREEGQNERDDRGERDEACKIGEREGVECEERSGPLHCNFAFFFAVPSDNPNPIPPGGAVSFSGKGASSDDNDSELIERVNDTQFLLKEPGTYEIYFQASVFSPDGERVLGAALGISQDIGSGPKMVNPSIVFTSVAFTQISNDYLLRTRQRNVVISIRNPPVEALPVVITTSAPLMSGGASLKIKRISCETEEDVERGSVEP